LQVEKTLEELKAGAFKNKLKQAKGNLYSLNQLPRT